MTTLQDQLRRAARVDSLFGDDVRKKITVQAADALDAAQAEIDRLKQHIKHIGNDALRTELHSLKAQAAKDAAYAAQAEIKGLTLQKDKWAGWATTAGAKVDELEKELAALKAQAAKDAADLACMTAQLRAAYGHHRGFYMNTCFECHKQMEFVDKRCHVCSSCADKHIDAAMKETK